MEGSSTDLDFTQSLNDRQIRRVYLITYSQADMNKFPTCESFAIPVVKAFKGKQEASSSPIQWACCKETHKDGGKHYHLAVKLTAPKRWKSVKNSLYKQHGIALHFSAQQYGYNVVYKYVCKEINISEVLHSEGHPNLQDIGSPKTKKGMKANTENAQKRKAEIVSTQCSSQSSQSSSQSSSSSAKAKIKRLSNVDVAEFMVTHNIHHEAELMAVAKERHDEGQKDLYQFIVGKSTKFLSELIDRTWKVNDAAATLSRENVSRMTLLKQHSEKDCATSCNGEWLRCAKEVLRHNEINVYVFASAIRQLILNGRQKKLNLLLVGPTNCGKSFLLNPLELIYKTFANPTLGTYNWLGLDECEVIYLNDLRWEQQLIPWNDFLLLLEGQTVCLPRPKNIYPTDICISRENTIPIFATSKSTIEYVGKFNCRDDRETEMMSTRWNTFKFKWQIPIAESKAISPCTHCFSRLVLLGSEED